MSHIMRAISLFSGCGGMDIGVGRAGFNTISSVEIDKFAAASLKGCYEKNNHDAQVINCDISEWSTP
ncbi:MAG: hypothetical protein LDLANPLL_01732 [Turneriella sp.]|nr:hypothetical protein [Turneriella sp.]